MDNQNLPLNIIPDGIPPIAKASQYDEGRVITFKLYEDKTVYIPPSGTTVELHGRKGDNKIFIYGEETNLVSLSGSVITVTTNKQMTAVSGNTLLQFKLFNGGKELATLNSLMRVQEDPTADGDISTSELPAIITRATEQMQRAEAAADRAALSEENAWAYESSAEASKDAAALSESNAAESEQNTAANRADVADMKQEVTDKLEAVRGYAESAESDKNDAAASADLAHKWATFGDSTEQPSATNNAEFWANQAHNAAGGGVSSFNGRAGFVLPQAGDYTPPMVGVFEYYFETVDDMNAAIAAGQVENGATMFVRKDYG